jgi:hypothetical protein
VITRVDETVLRRWRWRIPLDLPCCDEFFDGQGFTLTRRAALRAARRRERVGYGQLGHTRWELAQFALRQHGKHDDVLEPGWWFPEGFPDRLTWKAWLPRTWTVLMVAKVLIALALNRHVSIDYVAEDCWCAASGDNDSFQSQEGTFYSWTELRTLAGFRPSRWVFAVEREST